MSKVNHTKEAIPPLTQTQQEALNRMAAAPDDDMQELTDAQLAGMRRSAFYRPVKTQMAARVDHDVLAWFKWQGKDY